METSGGMADAAPRHVGDVEEAVDPTEIDERAVVGDVLDGALEHLPLGEHLEEVSKLSELVERLNAIDGVDASVKADLQEASELAGGLDPYLSRGRHRNPPLSASSTTGPQRPTGPTARSSAVYLEQEMLSGHVEGQTLKMLVHATRARRVLEIGMFTGYSALAMAEALPPDGIVVACEIDADVAAFAQRCFGESDSGERSRSRWDRRCPPSSELSRTVEHL